MQISMVLMDPSAQRGIKDSYGRCNVTLHHRVCGRVSSARACKVPRSPTVHPTCAMTGITGHKTTWTRPELIIIQQMCSRGHENSCSITNSHPPHLPSVIVAEHPIPLEFPAPAAVSIVDYVLTVLLLSSELPIGSISLAFLFWYGLCGQKKPMNEAGSFCGM